jgi:TonB family protein
MRIKFYFPLLLIPVLCFSTIVFAQKKLQKSSPKPPLTISGGIINGKALNLVKPPFPMAARVVRAEGVVYVQVTIDENGDIILAEAVSGHPLLHAAAVQAARASKFSPTTLEGQPVRVTGVIIYNFFTKMSLLEIGYELSFGENSARLPENYPALNISGNIPEEWREEKRNLTGLSYQLYSRWESAEEPEQNASKKSSDNDDSSTSQSTVGAGNLSAKAFTNPKEVLKGVNVKITNQLTDEQLKLWYFKLGQILGKINAEIENSNKILANIDELNKHLVNTPLNVSASIVNDARKIGEFFNESALDTERKQQLTDFVRNLKESPFAQ